MLSRHSIRRGAHVVRLCWSDLRNLPLRLPDNPLWLSHKLKGGAPACSWRGRLLFGSIPRLDRRAPTVVCEYPSRPRKRAWTSSNSQRPSPILHTTDHHETARVCPHISLTPSRAQVDGRFKQPRARQERRMCFRLRRACRTFVDWRSAAGASKVVAIEPGPGPISNVYAAISARRSRRVP